MKWRTVMKISSIALLFSMLIVTTGLQLDSTVAQDNEPTLPQDHDPTEEGNKALVRRMLDELWGTTERPTNEQLLEFYAPTFDVWPEVSSRGSWTPEEWEQQFFFTYHAVFPERELTIEHITATGDTVMVHFTFEGTFVNRGLTTYLTGISGTNPPTSEDIKWRGVFVYRVEDGKIVEERWYWNNTLADTVGFAEPFPW